MKSIEQTFKFQNDLGDYCRTGKLQNIPGISQERVYHYRRLVFNVVKNTMKQAFPLTLQVLGEEQFIELVDDFFSNHRARNPQIWKLPGEFYEYALKSDFRGKTDKVWLNDLLLFEWIEIEVHTMPDISSPETRHEGNLLKDILLVNPESRLIHINYPIHLMNVNRATENKGNYYILVCRDPDSGKVNFFNFSLFHAWLFNNLLNEKKSINEMIPDLKKTFKIEDDKSLIQHISSFISDLRSRHAILGFIN